MDIRTAAGGINDQTMRAAEALKRLQQLESLFPPSN
jgi:hypothetical protein